MKSLMDFFKQRSNGRRRRSFSEDPAKGMEYNGLNANYRVSRRIFDLDIARHPRVVRDIGQWVNVQESADLVNKDRPLIDYKRHKANGRER